MGFRAMVAVTVSSLSSSRVVSPWLGLGLGLGLGAVEVGVEVGVEG